jgi:hypothetical protein
MGASQTLSLAMKTVLTKTDKVDITAKAIKTRLKMTFSLTKLNAGDQKLMPKMNIVAIARLTRKLRVMLEFMSSRGFAA